MKLKTLQRSKAESKKLEKAIQQFNNLIIEIDKKDIPEKDVKAINAEIEKISIENDSEKVVLGQIKKIKSRIIKHVNKELKLVTKNYYRNTWMAVGMAAFGVPIGTALGASIGNMAFVGSGLAIGLAMGLAIGVGMDKKASEEGRQLDVEMDI